METVIEFFLFFAQCIFWVWAFDLLFKFIFRGRIKEIEEQHSELVSKVMDLLHQVKEEKHGDCYYWFDADTDQFLAQGRDVAEIRQHLKERFKGHVFIHKDQALAGPDLEAVPANQLILKNKNAIGIKT